MTEANREAARCVAESDPAWMGVEPAGTFLGLEGRVVLHAGPEGRNVIPQLSNTDLSFSFRKLKLKGG